METKLTQSVFVLCPVPNNFCNPVASQILTQVERVMMLDIIFFFKKQFIKSGSRMRDAVRLLP